MPSYRKMKKRNSDVTCYLEHAPRRYIVKPRKSSTDRNYSLEDSQLCQQSCIATNDWARGIMFHPSSMSVVL